MEPSRASNVLGTARRASTWCSLSRAGEEDYHRLFSCDSLLGEVYVGMSESGVHPREGRLARGVHSTLQGALRTAPFVGHGPGNTQARPEGGFGGVRRQGRGRRRCVTKAIVSEAATIVELSPAAGTARSTSSLV